MLAEAGFGEEGLEAIEQANRLQEEKQEEVEVEARKSFSRVLMMLKRIILSRQAREIK
eukprot:COSAG06_NODE_63324_length_262_cov_1.269939_1_plen_58_part_00